MLIHVFNLQNERFIIGYSAAMDRFSIALHERASLDDILLSIVTVSKAHSIKISSTQQSVHDQIQEAYKWAIIETPGLFEKLKQQGWDTEALFWGDRGIRWSIHNQE